MESVEESLFVANPGSTSLAEMVLFRHQSDSGSFVVPNQGVLWPSELYRYRQTLRGQPDLDMISILRFRVTGRREREEHQFVIGQTYKPEIHGPVEPSRRSAFRDGFHEATVHGRFDLPRRLIRQRFALRSVRDEKLANITFNRMSASMCTASMVTASELGLVPSIKIPCKTRKYANITPRSKPLNERVETLPCSCQRINGSR